MGNQGTASGGHREAIALIQKGGSRGRQGSSHLDESTDLGARHRPAYGVEAGPAVSPLGFVPRPGAGTAVSTHVMLRSLGAAGSISAPAPWATWRATP